jgi:ubiquinone/menaquinone biosynthesis C-methylase UbiE
VLVESVLAFVEDKARAIGECIRVTKPGGYVGLNEALWLTEPPADKVAQTQGLGTEILTEAAWRALWDSLNLHHSQIEIASVEARTETRDRIEWAGWSWVLKAWRRVLGQYVKNPAFRQALKEQFDTPMELFRCLGYGLSVGQKPTGDV